MIARLRRWGWRPWLVVLFLLGVAMVVGGLRAGSRWLDRGRLVATATAEPADALPWTLALEVPEARVAYLLESTLTARSSADTAAPQPRLALTAPSGARAAYELEPAGNARSVERGERVRLVHHWRWTPAEQGRHVLELTAAPVPDAALLAWSVRLARDVPAQPSARPWVLLGFGLAALGLAGGILLPPRGSGTDGPRQWAG